MNRLLLLLFVAILNSCSDKKKTNKEILNQLLKPSDIVGKVSEVKQLGGAFDTIFIFKVKFDEAYSLEDFKKIPMMEVAEKSHNELMNKNLKRHYSDISDSLENKIFFTGTRKSSLLLKVMLTENFAYFIGERP